MPTLIDLFSRWYIHYSRGGGGGGDSCDSNLVKSLNSHFEATEYGADLTSADTNSVHNNH